MNRTVPVATLQEHFNSLCEAHNITPDYSRSRDGSRFYRQNRVLAVRPVLSEITYIAGIRTLGYWVGARRAEPRRYHLAGAWCWATRQGLPEVVEGPEFNRRLQREAAWTVKHAVRKGYEVNDDDPLMRMALYGPYDRSQLTPTGRVRS